MTMFPNFFFVVILFTVVYAFQNSYRVKQERIETGYFDPEVVFIEAGVSKLNRTTNAVNITFSLKQDLTDKDLCIVKGYKWMSNQYRLDILQFEYTIKMVMGIKYFDIGRLLHEYTTPPLTWPIQKNVYYKMQNWVPDSSQFPPGMPEGKWKIAINYTRANRTPMLGVNWYVSLEYKVKYGDAY